MECSRLTVFELLGAEIDFRKAKLVVIACETDPYASQSHLLIVDIFTEVILSRKQVSQTG
jgi:hypothetical protein